MPESRPTALGRRLLGAAFLLALALQLTLVPSAAAVQPADTRPSPEASAPAPSPELPARLQKALAEALRRARRHSVAPGLSMAVVAADGREWHGVSGRHANGEPLRPRHSLRIGSVTKTFTAAIILSLVQEGRIGLDLRADRWLPKVRLLRQVTVRQLLNHTSGIQDLYGPASRHLNGSPNRHLSSNAVLRPLTTNRSPGHVYSYSNTNFYLLGLLIEKVTGNSFNEELEKRFGDVIDLDATHLLETDDPMLPAAWTTAFWTSGAMVSTPTDLARWGHALYGSDLLPRKLRKAMLNFRSGHRYGLGAQQLPLGKRWVPGHSGLLYDTTSLLVHLPKQKVTIAIVGTAPHTDLEAALTRRYGGRSIMQLLGRLGH